LLPVLFESELYLLLPHLAPAKVNLAGHNSFYI
jgi:hypothetical protein